MPKELWYLIAVFAVAIIGFMVIKRPLYECMLYSFVVLVAITGTWENVGSYILDALQDSSLYVIFVFIISAALLSKTSVIDDCVKIILAVFGRIRGGAGFVAIIGSSYMGSLSGSGPGNVATTGVFTIPAMIGSGYPPHLAANVEAHASTMGNMIPPAGMIATAFAILNKMYPGKYTLSQYWLLLWGIALWFVVQRIVTLYAMCRYYKVEAMKKQDLPNLRQTLKSGWKAIFLPIIVFVPFLLASKFEPFILSRIGGKSGSLSNVILLMMPVIIVICGILLSNKQSRKSMSFARIYSEIKNGMLKVVPTASLVLFAYFVSNVFEDLNVETVIGQLIADFNMSKVALCFLIPLFTAILGMLLPGSSQVKIFGGTIIAVLAAAGVNPMLAAGMLPCICGSMHGVTPPYCACVYTGMGIAQSELKPTLLNCFVWIILHYLLSVVVLLGLLPLFGLIG